MTWRHASATIILTVNNRDPHYQGCWRRYVYSASALQWRHNGRDNVSNHQLPDCLLNCWFRRWSNKHHVCCVVVICTVATEIEFSLKCNTCIHILLYRIHILSYRYSTADHLNVISLIKQDFEYILAAQNTLSIWLSRYHGITRNTLCWNLVFEQTAFDTFCMTPLEHFGKFNIFNTCRRYKGIRRVLVKVFSFGNIFLVYCQLFFKLLSYLELMTLPYCGV